MVQLYTVRMNRKILHITDAGRTERLVEEVYHDLPLALANRYAEKFPDAGVRITPTAKNDRPRRSPGALADRDEAPVRRSGGFRVSNETQAQRRAKGLPPREAKPVAAAGYGDVVNEMLRKGA